MKNKIIALLGMPGSGKTAVIDYLIKKHNWPKVYFGEVTFDEIKRRGLEVNPKNEQEVREDLRAKFGKDHYAKEVVKKLNKLKENNDVILVESLYMWTEYLILREAFGEDLYTIAVYVSPDKRVKRIGERKDRPLTKEELEIRDRRQIETLEQGGPIAIADRTIINHGTIEELYENVDEVVEEILKS